MQRFPLLPALACTLVLAGCGSGQNGSAPAAKGGAAIRAVGSSTVYPFSTAVAESFKRKFPKAATPIIESTGTGGGIKLFCAGVGASHPDMANASRRIKASEVAQCAQNGVKNIIEIQIGIDGITLARARNAAPISLTTADVWRALAATDADNKPNSTKNWSDVRSGLPAHRIEVLGPPPTSGTRDAFNDMIMEGGCKSVPAIAALKASDEDGYKKRCTQLREDGVYVEAGENDNLIVQKLAANPIAIGVFGHSYLEENADKLAPISLNGVEPTTENITNGSYPAARKLYIYIKGEHLKAKPALRDYVLEYASEAAWGPKGYLRAKGLIASPDDARAANAKIAQDLTPLDPASLK